jgi:hypothetical protein
LEPVQVIVYPINPLSNWSELRPNEVIQQWKT